MAAVGALASDLQQALQNAIVQANNPFVLQQPDQPSKKKRKRVLAESDPTDGDVEDAQQAAPPEKKKKKKKKSKNGEISVVIDARSGGPIESAQMTTTVTEAPKPKKKSKGKGKAKDIMEMPQTSADSTSVPDIPIDPALTGLSGSPSNNGNLSNAAFLNAILAAAAAVSDNVPQDGPSIPDVHAHNQYPGFPHVGPQGFVSPEQAMFSAHFDPTAVFLPQNGIPNANGGDNIIRALQELDLTKIAAVLKNLSDAANPSDASFMQGSSTLAGNQNPINSADLLGKPQKKHKRTLPDISLIAQPEHDTEHAQLLATKWMNASKLADLTKTIGLVYKKGKFSAIEEAQVKHAIENYRASKGLNDQQLNELIFQKDSKQRDNAFWSEITAQVPLRPIIAVYHHVRRSYHPLKQQGKWMPVEDETLRVAVQELGQAWEKVSQRVGRMAGDCRDRWRNHLADRENRQSGQWSKEEEQLLTKIVLELLQVRGTKDQDNDIFWGQVAQRMGNRRGRQQCRIKWTDSLSKTIKNDGQKPRWSQQDAYILVHKVASLNVRDDSEIDWKLLPDSEWNLWSAHSLQRRWLTLKRSVRGYEGMTHAEIMEVLRAKKSHVPPPPPPIRKPRITSAPEISPEVELAIQSNDPSSSDAGEGVLAPDMVHVHEDLEAALNDENMVPESSSGSGSSSSEEESDDSSDSD